MTFASLGERASFKRKWRPDKHKPHSVHYPACLSQFSTETLCPISYFTLFRLQFITRPPCPHRFRVSQFFCSCSHHLEFPSLGHSKQLYHILFSPPTENLLLHSSFSASLVPHPSPQPSASDSATNRRHCALYKFIYLLTYTSHASDDRRLND